MGQVHHNLTPVSPEEFIQVLEHPLCPDWLLLLHLSPHLFGGRMAPLGEGGGDKNISGIG